jgi:polyferredoxin
MQERVLLLDNKKNKRRRKFFFLLWLALALVSGVSYFWAVSFSPEDPSPAANNAMFIWAFTLLQTIHILKVILKDKAVALYFLPNEKKFALSCKS